MTLNKEHKFTHGQIVHLAKAKSLYLDYGIEFTIGTQESGVIEKTQDELTTKTLDGELLYEVRWTVHLGGGSRLRYTNIFKESQLVDAGLPIPGSGG